MNNKSKIYVLITDEGLEISNVPYDDPKREQNSMTIKELYYKCFF